MAKSSDVHDLLIAYKKQAMKIPAKGVYATRQRQQEVNAAHARKLMRKRRRQWENQTSSDLDLRQKCKWR